MKDKIKRVDTDYWFIVFLWLVGSMSGENMILTAISGGVIAGYLAYMMAGDSDGR